MKRLFTILKEQFSDFKLKFDRQTEEKFLDDYIEKSLVVIRVGYLICILLYGIFGVLDIWIVPETKLIAWFIRFVIVIPIACLIIIFSFFNFFKRHNQILLIISSSIAGLGIVMMIACSKPTELGYNYYYSGLILVIVWIYAFIRLRFWNSLIASLIIVTGYEIVAIFIQHLTSKGLDNNNLLVFINNNFFFISANILGLFASFHIEKLHRSDFLQNQTILLQNKELKEINAIKDKFFSIIAHDLRNPFIGIKGITELMEKELKKLDNEKSNQLLQLTQMIGKSSMHAFELLENLLQWSRSQTGKININPQNTSIQLLISNTLSIVNVNAFKKNITIERDILDSYKVYADISMTYTILRNLFTNAIKFTHPNGKIIISTQMKEKLIEISIFDTGIGIEPENLEKLFRADIKFTNPGTDNEKGTGLGLLLCKEFIEKQGGKIWVTSKLGIGSTFTFTLPIGR
jgi:signal transduction histidine kinase